ncbi:MAG: hypothetical protein QW794_05360 [Thermosphaera sp.]
MLLLDQVQIDNITLFVIEGGKVGLAPLFRLGPFSIGSEGFKTKIAELIEEKPRKTRFSGGEIVCVYLLHYGSFIKIGTSRLRSVVARMISQAPFLGIVAAVIELRDDFEYRPESIERWAVDIARNQGFNMLRDRRCELRDLVKLWRRPPNGFIDQLEKVEAEWDPLIADRMPEAARIAVEAAKVHGALLFVPNTFWFTTDWRSMVNTDLPPPLLPEELKKGQDVVIKAYSNGLLCLRAEWAQKSLGEDNGERICILHEMRKVLFEVTV